MIGLSFLTPRQVRRVALALLFVCLAHDGRRALRRRGDQRLAALAVRRRHVDPALGADEAGLHRHHRLALRGRQPPAGRAGPDAGGGSCSSSPPRCSSPSRISARRSSSSRCGARSSSWPAPTADLRRTLGGLGARRPVLGLLRVSACRRAHQPLPRSGERRQFPDHDRHAVLRARRLVGHRAGRGDHEARASGFAHRLRLRRGRRGVRHPALPADRRALLACSSCAG